MSNRTEVVRLTVSEKQFIEFIRNINSSTDFSMLHHIDKAIKDGINNTISTARNAADQNRTLEASELYKYAHLIEQFNELLDDAIHE